MPVPSETTSVGADAAPVPSSVTPAIQSIRPTDAEKAAGRLSERNLQKALEVMHEDGILMIENVVDHAHLDALNERMAKDTAILANMKDRPVQQVRGNIQQEPPPEPEYFFNDVFMNKLAINVTSAYLGGRPKMTFNSGNTALNGTESQRIHCDAGLLQPKIPFGVAVNTGLVEMNPINGSTELWFGTHTIPLSQEILEDIRSDSGSGKIKLPVLEARKKDAPHRGPVQPVVPKGSILIRDLRLWHGGKPNTTHTPRIMLAQIHFAPWFRNQMRLELPKGMEKMIEHPDLEVLVNFTDGAPQYLSRPFDRMFDFRQVP